MLSDNFKDNLAKEADKKSRPFDESSVEDFAAFQALYLTALKNGAINEENLTLDIARFKESLEELKDKLDKIYLTNIEAEKYLIFNNHFHLFNSGKNDWKISEDKMSASNYRKQIELRIFAEDETEEWYCLRGLNEDGGITIEDFCALENVQKYLEKLVDKLNSGKLHILEKAIEQTGKWNE